MLYFKIKFFCILKNNFKEVKSLEDVTLKPFNNAGSVICFDTSQYELIFLSAKEKRTQKNTYVHN